MMTTLLLCTSRVYSWYDARGVQYTLFIIDFCSSIKESIALVDDHNAGFKLIRVLFKKVVKKQDSSFQK